jgi:putative hydrolase of the HAD superfamily
VDRVVWQGVERAPTRPRASRYQAVLFDFSRTLFDPDRVVDGPALQAAAQRRGASISASAATVVCAGILGYADSAAGRALLAGCDTSADRHRGQWLAVAGAVPGSGAPAAEAFYDCLVDPARWLPYADTVPTLRALQAAGTRIAVVSNTGWDLRATFAHHGLAGLVDGYVLSYEEGCEKPDPRLFRAACDQLGVAPAQSLMVGDDPRTDSGALAVGMNVLLLCAPQPGSPVRGLAEVTALCLG